MTAYLITGANRGIGLELTRRLLERGDDVWAAARAPQSAPALLELSRQHRGRLHPLALDVADAVSVAAARVQVGDAVIDVLVNNAGVVGPGRQSTSDMDFGGFVQTLEVNTLGPLRVIQAFMPNLSASPAAKIVTLTSRMGSMSMARSDHVAYRASKAAANKVMQALATDLGPRGIAVAALHPGWVRTDMGGSGADIDVGEAAEGLIGVIDRLDVAGAGRFLDWRGEELPW